MVRHLTIIIVVCTHITMGCAITTDPDKPNTFKNGESWHFIQNDKALSLISAPTAYLGSLSYINVICHYEVSSISNDCITMLNFVTYPQNYGTFATLEPIETVVMFTKNKTNDRRLFTFYSFRKGLMLSPVHVDEFLDLISPSDTVTFGLRWKKIQATRDTHHSAAFHFNLQKTEIAIKRFKSLVLTKTKKEAPKIKRKAADIVRDYL